MTQDVMSAQAEEKARRETARSALVRALAWLDGGATCETGWSKEERLSHYAERDLIEFSQYDGFAHAGGDDCMHADEDGHAIMWCQTADLMRGSDVRVLIRRGIDPAVALALLDKIRESIAHDVALKKERREQRA